MHVLKHKVFAAAIQTLLKLQDIYVRTLKSTDLIYLNLVGHLPAELTADNRLPPASVTLFLTNLLKCPSHKEITPNVSRLVESFSYDLIHGVSKGNVITAKHFLLGLGLQVFRVKKQRQYDSNVNVNSFGGKYFLWLFLQYLNSTSQIHPTLSGWLPQIRMRKLQCKPYNIFKTIESYLPPLTTKVTDPVTIHRYTQYLQQQKRIWSM